MTLYRKYRPQKFAEVEGQEHIVTTLKNELRLSKVAHAYIFAGPRGTGKTSIARILAKAVNCQNRTLQDRRKGLVEPCNRCPSCKEITAGKSLDLIEIDAASNRGIDEIRALRENTRFAPSKNATKIFIIDEVHMLTREAFNALLKTLEEPPTRTIFILATTEIHKVLPTILSRCQRFDFHKLSTGELVHRLQRILKLEKVKLDPAIVSLIASRADGASRDAESILGQILSWPAKQRKATAVADFLGAVDWSKIFAFGRLLAARDQAEAIRMINALFEQGQNLLYFSERMIDFLRGLCFAKVNPQLVANAGIILNSDQEQELLALAQQFSLKDLTFLIKLFLEAKRNIPEGAIEQLPLEMACLEFFTQTQKEAVPLSTPPKQGKAVSVPDQVTLPPHFPSPTRATSAPQMSLDEVITKWNNVIEAVQPLNHSLCAFLKLCRPMAFKNGALILGFPHDFHKDIVAKATNRKTIEGVLDHVLGGKWQIQCEKIQSSQDNILTQEALEVLGGEMVQ